MRPHNPRHLTHSTPPRRPLLVYDGNCEFCRLWITRWRAIAGEWVDFAPSAELATVFPELPGDLYAKSVVLIEPSGDVFAGAEAALRTLAHSPGKDFLYWIYRHMFGAGWLMEKAYAFIARRRDLALKTTRLLWGASVEPRSYQRGANLFLRGLALVYALAFWSANSQLPGLVGADGILPAQEFLESAREGLGDEAWTRFPTVFWFGASDQALTGVCVIGILLGVLACVGPLIGPLYLILWALYLSVVAVGRDFFAFQWDALLLEAGLIAVFAAPWRMTLVWRAHVPNVTIWLWRWLLFRLMFMSGVAKLASGEPSWRSLGALDAHFLTQPLPTPLAWYAHHLPVWSHTALTFVMFAVELAIPLLIFMTPRLKRLAVWLFLAVQVGIALTGNYAFFNLLAALLCLPLLDDNLFSAPTVWRKAPDSERTAYWGVTLRGAFLALVVTISSFQLAQTVGLLVNWPTPVRQAAMTIAPFRSVNYYGLFSVMTVRRPEIILEGSDDLIIWREYEFRYKPGDTLKALSWVAPHQPRLDWQMWFAALDRFDENEWFFNLTQALLTGTPGVLALLEKNPFPDRPPHYVRALLYEYVYTTPAERGLSGALWRRTLIGQYCPVVERIRR